MQAARVAIYGALVMTISVAGCIGSPGNNGNNAGSAGSSGGGGQTAGDSRTIGGGQTQPPARASDAARQFPLDSMATAKIDVNGNTFRVWLARTSAQTTEGLMHVPTEEIEDDQGMLFVFSSNDFRSFWMRNTIAPLDIAFIRSDGLIVKIHTMPILTLQSFPSERPAQFALEVKAGTFERLGIREGDHVEIPAAVSNTSP